MITLICVLAILIGIGLCVMGIVFWYLAHNEDDRVKFSKYSMYVILGVIIFFCGIMVATTTQQIGPGHRGVVLKWGGEVEPRVMNEGLNFKIPFVETVVEVDVKVQAHPFDKIDAASKEMQSVILSGKVNWHFDPAKVYTTYQNIGASGDFVNKILDSALSDYLKESTPKYEANKILANRTNIRNDAIRTLGDNLTRYNIIIDDIYIQDIQFSKEYTAAIEKQQVAERQIETERNLLTQKQIQAQQAEADAQGVAKALVAKADGEKIAAITRAEGEKTASITRAEGDKQSKILVSEADQQATINKATGEASAIEMVAKKQAEANNLLAKSINESLINYNYVNKIGPDVKVIMMPTGVPMIISDAITK